MVRVKYINLNNSNETTYSLATAETWNNYQLVYEPYEPNAIDRNSPAFQERLKKIRKAVLSK